MKTRQVSRAAEILMAVLLTGLTIGLAGCDGFFVPLNPTATPGTGAGKNDFVYVGNQAASSSIAGYGIGTGAFVSVPHSPVVVNFTPTALVVSPDNKFLYVGGNGVLFAFAIATDGSLTAQNGGSPVGVVSVAAMDVSPDGNYLYVLDGVVSAGTNAGAQNVGTIDVFQITRATGLLTQAPSVVFTAGNTVTVVPRAIKVAPSGNALYAAVGTAGVLTYALDSTRGVLSNGLLYVPPANSSDNAVAIDAASSLLYVAQSGVSNGVVGFTIAAKGTLAPVAGSPFTSGLAPSGVVLDATSKYLYASNQSDGTVTGYTIGAAGALTPLANTSYPAGTGVDAIGRDNSGKYIVAAALGGAPDLSLFSFSAAAPGTLVRGSTVAPATTSSPGAIALTH